jgi:ATP-dependent DNA ligase
MPAVESRRLPIEAIMTHFHRLSRGGKATQGRNMPKSALDLPTPLSLEPLEAEPVDDLPRGKGWLYGPKYDGFRCLAFRDDDGPNTIAG